MNDTLDQDVHTLQASNLLVKSKAEQSSGGANAQAFSIFFVHPSCASFSCELIFESYANKIMILL